MDTPEVIASPLPSEARLRAIVESSFDAIVGKNLNSIITDWNPAAERLFGYAADEAIGRSIVMLIPDDLVREETEIIRQIASGNQVPSFDTVRKHKDGTLIDVSVTVSPIRDQAGVIVGASKIARDIRQKKEADRRIRVLLREVNHRVKNQFSVILSVLRETSRRATDTASFVEILEQRIMGLSRSQDILVSSGWTGAELAELVCDHLRPFGHDELVEIAGPSVKLAPPVVSGLGMALHELGTNSSKYGALSGRGGRVMVNWAYFEADGKPMVRLVWDETSSSDQVAVAGGGDKRRGFGTIILERLTPNVVRGVAELERGPGRVRWTLTAPVETMTVEADDTELPEPEPEPI